MKQKFSKHWISSKQTRKQRKYRYNAPLHIANKFLSSNLAKSLREKYGRSIPARKGDTVLIMRGKFKGKKGKITKVDLKKKKVAIEGIQRQKKDGTKINILFDASKLQIQELNLEDKKRIKSKQAAFVKSGKTQQKEIEESKKIKQGEKKNAS